MKKVRGWEKSGIEGELYQGKALEFLSNQADASVNLIFLDPPFNLGKKYSEKYPSLDNKPESEYSKWMNSLLSESTRILSPGGALYLYHIPNWALKFGAELEKKLNFRHWIAISMKNGFVRGQNLYPAHYALLYFTKGEPAQFARPKLKPQTCRHCGKYVKDYGGYKHIIEKKGLNLSDMWEDISPVRHASKKFRDANELPQEITDRVVNISGDKNLVFLDPFAGAGTSILSAINKGMHFKGCDLIKENCNIIVDRIDEYTNKQKEGRLYA